MSFTDPTGRGWIALCVSLLLLGCASAQSPSVGGQSPAPVKIMCLGDSITEGLTGRAGWRYWLWRDLQGSGYVHVDFIGSQHGAFLGPPLYSNFDQDHEAYWGSRVDQLLQHMPSVFARGHIPDVVLIHAGHNDITQGQSVYVTAGEILSLVSAIRAVNRNCVFLVAQVIPTANASAAASLQTLNTLIGSWGPSYSMANSPILVVDQAGGFDPTTDLYDGVHPNELGERKMSEKWLRALGAVLGPFKTTLTHDPASGLLLARNLGGPPGQGFLTVLTTDPANANGGLGTGWFGGLHISWNEVLVQSTAAGPPFVGQLDLHGSSSSVFPIAVPASLMGVPIYSGTVAVASGTGGLIGYARPATVTVQ